MRAQDIAVGMLVAVRDVSRWSHVDGSPVADRPYRVTDKYTSGHYKEPWIRVDDGGVYRAKDLRLSK